ncbi:MAG: VOC family protein [Candidatus Magasanikbacteria bacterium]
MLQITPYDPCGHTKLAVSDFKKSYTFYKEIFDELEYQLVSNKDDHATWASPDGYAILITQAKITNYPYKFGAPGLHHLCLKAHSAELVDKIYQLLRKKGVYIFDTPQKYPDYTDKYYAVYFADPDGIKLEVAYY